MCKTCTAPCRCECHKDEPPRDDEYRFGGGKYRIHRGEVLEIPTEEARGLDLALKAYAAEYPGLRCWPNPGDPSVTIVSWLDEPGAET